MLSIFVFSSILGKRGAGAAVQEQWHKFQKMYTLFMGPVVIVVINDYKLTKELFAKEEFSGRPINYLFTNIKGFNGHKRGIITTDGHTWTHQRRFALKQLRDLGFGRKSLDSVMIEEIGKFCQFCTGTLAGVLKGIF